MSTGDAFIALGMGVVSWLLVLDVLEGEGDRALGLLLVTVHTGVLAWRRQAPLVVLAIMGATALATAALGYPSVVLGPAAVAGVHAVAAESPRRISLVALGAAVIVMALVVARSNADASTIVGNSLVLAVGWAVGERGRKARTQVVEAEIAGEALAHRAVVDERLRIARELHDVVAHALSIIAVQAGTGRVVLDSSPSTAKDALTTIETTSREALSEMRRLLGLLRADEGTAVPLAPTPGLGDVDGLVAAGSASGLVVDVSVDGDRRPLAPGPDLAAYRILQEALTNVRRHSGGSRASVRIDYGHDALVLEVVDDGRGLAMADGAGHGLVGMQERAALYGGRLETGPGPEGGYRVWAEIPYTGR